MANARRRANGEGTIYWNADRNRYEGMVVLHADGETRRRKVTGKTKAMVRDRLDVLRREAEDGAIRADKTVTVKAYIDAWKAGPLATLDVRESTRRNYADVLDAYVIPTWGKRKLAGLTPSIVKAGLVDLAEAGRSQSTIRLAKVTLGFVCDQAVEDRIIGRNPVRTVRLPKAKPARERRAMTADEADRLLQTVEDTALHAPVFVALATGLRPGELLALRWDDLVLDGDMPTLRVREAKTAKGRRVVPLPAAAVDVLKAHRLVGRSAHRFRETHGAETAGRLGHARPPLDDDLVFPSTSGTAWDLANYRRAFRDACARAGIGQWTPHELRHTTASWLIAKGVPLKVVSELLGHSGISVTSDVYGHLLGPSKEVADVLDGLLTKAG